MSPEPTLKPLSKSSRTKTFGLLFLIFIIMVPVFVFYATGYRYSPDDRSNITTVGGFYINTDTENTNIYVNDALVEDMRLFRSAAYVQNIESGLHNVSVQGKGVQTWTKRLPVYSRIVTEAEAFNMPVTPQVRLISQYETVDGDAIFQTTELSTTTPFENASTTNNIIATSTIALNDVELNPEHEYVSSLFSATTSTTTVSVGENLANIAENFRFYDDDNSLDLATSTRRKPNALLSVNEEGDVYASYTGSTQNRPYYYCIFYTGKASTTEAYGEHVYDSIKPNLVRENSSQVNGQEKVCRSKIKIDDKRQRVSWFNFFPGSIHRVLMLLEDGLYVVEVDDRSWQNVQLLYPGENLKVRLDNEEIYVYDGEIYFEVLTEIAEQQ